ncbi:MAG: hypothetical protein IPI00_15615 [Flavobacteriales bacterium]|nr:hypothetical protein [Flavobacteriales bacterium]
MNSGLPFVDQVSKFSIDQTAWLNSDPNCTIEIDHFKDATLDLNQLLATTLPSMERSVTTAGYGNVELLQALGIPKRREIGFLLSELQKLKDRPRVMDLLFDSLGFYLKIRPKNRTLSRAYNVLDLRKPFFQTDIPKQFDQRELLDRVLPEATVLTDSTKALLLRTLKYAMVLKDRETDPVTYMDERTVRLYELEQGITIAIYGMVPARQLVLESYVGYTLFKNGYPAAYGGAWIFGQRAEFGINIFEAFRGGGSGYMMCQLLRVFRQVFQVERFEIEPYQFGLDNADGIASGAYWFYYKHGFRSMDTALAKLAETEVERRKVHKGHRTSTRVLIRFTESYLALTLGDVQKMGVHDITDKVKRLIRTTYSGDRDRAENESVKKFLKRTGGKNVNEPDGVRVLKEVALWAEALRVTDQGKLDLLHRMITAKPSDPYSYQELLLRYFN